MLYFGHLGNDAYAAASGDPSMTNAQKAAQNLNPTTTDTDGDGSRDSSDQYPADSRRSRDLPVLTYAAIDVSTVARDLPVKAVALDDDNKVGLAFEDSTKIYSAVLQNGAVVSGTSLEVVKANTTTYNLGLSGPYITATGSYVLGGTSFTSGKGPVNTQGHLAGHIVYESPSSPVPSFTRGWTASSSTPVEISPPRPVNEVQWPGVMFGIYLGATCYRADFLGNSDVCYAEFEDQQSVVANGSTVQWYKYYNFGLRGEEILGATAADLRLGGPRSPGGKATGSYFGYATNTTISILYDFPSWSPVGTATPVAVNNSGTILGRMGNSWESTSYLTLSTDNGSPLANALPSALRLQIRFPATDNAHINNNGDLLLAAEVLEGPATAPVWNPRTVLWKMASGEVSVAQFPANVTAIQQFNNSTCATAIGDVTVTDANGQPVTKEKRALYLLPVEFEVTQWDPKIMQPKPPFIRNLRTPENPLLMLQIGEPEGPNHSFDLTASVKMKEMSIAEADADAIAKEWEVKMLQNFVAQPAVLTNSYSSFANTENGEATTKIKTIPCLDPDGTKEATGGFDVKPFTKASDILTVNHTDSPSDSTSLKYRKRRP